MNPQQPDTATSLRDEARELLRRLTGASEADFHDGQYEAIHALVADRARTLVVQRTGWGKSAVYFISSLLLRARGTGPALIISPLLSLMRDQVAAASRAGPHPRAGRSRRARRAPGWPRAAQQPGVPRAVAAVSHASPGPARD